ncbi:ribosome-binding factor A [Ehrlichia chaffeensis str. Heartland]|uniref:Ribosome-binding factor A n=1 Tax=Ehrlichia chaffeensis (strain ATCC CRL-10679 / Arkansas) TaxID=205920 RepID=Q2GGQ7_EHRCR|nr:30S ribosome-binding factor RbfA [Ehrlichia chaffeensis]ABD45050.1 ribosome-binding factor A [Ehrlichia chaffeensis str. Arkansas]AHX03655.1 ribosome-binding factor A [Ehrlichia chaffeensis str. Heartland]AHX05624.1 ribosome-binding factor A [Ehrlichia chaffeensis str. Jax]AHX06615.1 ribosome-binding factor A [Ehrlichia chaffeensis str. Liberty]AHX07092.1 ribosome-binding factor A [Ehrlichia chaffeensis str. Osceola]
MIYKSESFRNLKVASVLNRAISRVLMQDICLFNSHITISKVEVSSDIRDATVFVIISQECSDKEALIKELNDSSYFIRKAIFSYVDLRYIPRLYFKLDYCFDNLVRVNQILESK